MKRSGWVLTVLYGLPAIASADDWQHGCVAPPAQCAPACQCPTPCVPSQVVPPQGLVTRPQGAFVAGPQAGEVEGEARSFGMRFGAIRIPEISLPFPTIQLPSLVQYRRDARMITQSQSAPFVEGQVSEFDLQARPQAEPTPPAVPQSTPYMPQHCVPMCPPAGCTQNDMDRLEEKVKQLQNLVEQLATLQLQQSPVPEAVSAQQALTAAESAYNNQFNVQSNQFESQYQQKCQESDALRAQLAELQQSYQQMLDTKQRQIVAQREDRLRQQFGQPAVTESAAPQAPAPRPMPAVARKIEPASYQETVAVPALYRPSTSDEVFGEATDSAAEYQWRQPGSQPRQTTSRAQTATRSAPSQAAAQGQSRTVPPNDEGKLSKGLLSRWFGGRK